MILYLYIYLNFSEIYICSDPSRHPSSLEALLNIVFNDPLHFHAQPNLPIKLLEGSTMKPSRKRTHGSPKRNALPTHSFPRLGPNPRVITAFSGRVVSQDKDPLEESTSILAILLDHASGRRFCQRASSFRHFILAKFWDETSSLWIRSTRAVSVTGTLKHVKSSVARTGGIVLRWSSGYGAGG